MTLKRPVADNFPTEVEIADALADAMRDVELLKGMLKLAGKAAHYRECDREAPELNRALAELEGASA